MKPPRGPTFRPATPDELELTYRIKREAFGPYIDLAFGWDEEEQRLRHKEEFSPESIRIVEHDRQTIGYIRLKIQPNALYLSQIFIRAAHQGQGIGAECMRRLIKEARQQKLPMRLQVLRVNPRAQRFYERLGFRRAGETANHVQFELPVKKDEA